VGLLAVLDTANAGTATVRAQGATTLRRHVTEARGRWLTMLTVTVDGPGGVLAGPSGRNIAYASTSTTASGASAPPAPAAKSPAR
jgi:hypothetical protein